MLRRRYARSTNIITMANCNVTWYVFRGDVPDSLIYFFIIYCYAVCLVGLVCNVVAMWCVVGCSRTPTAIKVLLCAIFSTTLLSCLLVMPFVAYNAIAKVHCNLKVPDVLILPIVSVYIILTEMETLYITIMAFLRAMAVWSSTKREVNIRMAVALSVGTAIYCTAMTWFILARPWEDILGAKTRRALILFYNSLHYLIPITFTIACYLSMMLAVRRNKQRLAATTHAATTAAAPVQVLDQATRAMLAVFISNLVFGLPHSIYHILPYDYHVFSYVIVHIVFYMHLFVDPLVFVCFNLHHRQRVLQALKTCLQCASCSLPVLPHSTSTLPLHVTPRPPTTGSGKTTT